MRSGVIGTAPHMIGHIMPYGDQDFPVFFHRPQVIFHLPFSLRGVTLSSAGAAARLPSFLCAHPSQKEEDEPGGRILQLFGYFFSTSSIACPNSSIVSAEIFAHSKRKILRLIICCSLLTSADLYFTLYAILILYYVSLY